MTLKIEDGEITEGFEEFTRKTDDPYMEMMVKALAKVSNSYIVYDSSYHVEHTYVCEFYHQWSKLLEIDQDKQLCLNGEPCKHLPKKSKESWKFPDLILHHSQCDNEDNRIACEFKRKIWKEGGFKKDMETLNYLLKGADKSTKLEKNFKWYIFLQIGGTIDKLKKYVRKNSFNKDIWCIIVNDNATQLTIQTIGELTS